jgi:hypothetical protein
MSLLVVPRGQEGLVWGEPQDKQTLRALRADGEEPVVTCAMKDYPPKNVGAYKRGVARVDQLRAHAASLAPEEFIDRACVAYGRHVAPPARAFFGEAARAALDAGYTRTNGVLKIDPSRSPCAIYCLAAHLENRGEQIFFEIDSRSL